MLITFFAPLSSILYPLSSPPLPLTPLSLSLSHTHAHAHTNANANAKRQVGIERRGNAMVKVMPDYKERKKIVGGG
jgi:hypothetical protein